MAHAGNLPKNANNVELPLTPPRPAGPLLIGLLCLGSGVALAAGRQALLSLAPPLTPQASTAELQRARWGSVDPDRRRDAALLLSSRLEPGAPQRRRLLQGQGWGRGALAPIALKQAALSAQARGQTHTAQILWGELLQRFPDRAASADALYALGRQIPALRRQLLQRFPAHPAALAAAAEAGDAVHLARWGPRWPGAEPLLLERCRQSAGLKPHQQQALAGGLAQLQQGRAALRCLGAVSAPPELQLSIDRALLQGEPADQRLAQQRLLALAQQQPGSAAGQEAAALLAEEPGADALAALRQLPAPLQASAAVQARLALEGQRPWRAVLQRWPRHPSSWELQWQLARRQLLERRWPEAEALLAALDPRWLPAPLAARQQFWRGYGASQRGNQAEAQRLWRELLQTHPGGYYAWRAAARLGIDAPAAPATSPTPPWRPLNSGDGVLDVLWRTGQTLEAWESWRHQRRGQPAQGAQALALEGRLRTGIGDDWTGLGQLEQASLRLPQGTCRQHWQLEQDLHPRRFEAEFQRAGQREQVDPQLLLAVARQESRFSPGVRSAVGAVGLLQLMPATAAELAGMPLSTSQLQDPSRNAELGARYLRQLLNRWRQQPFLSVASYNAGPGAVERWRGPGVPDPQREPELWVEAIPYPETRLYAKKVLGNRWTYQLIAATGDQACTWSQAR